MDHISKKITGIIKDILLTKEEKMRIGINARMFEKEQHTGIARSVLEILKIWVKEYGENEYYLFSNNEINVGFPLPSNWHVVIKKCVVNRGIIWDECELPRLIKKHNIEVFWGTNFSLPPKTRRTKYYVTIYDLAAFKIKGVTEKKNLIKLHLNVPKACKRADKVIAISKATAQDIEEKFGIDDKKLEVSYCGGLPSNYEYCMDYDMTEINPMLIFPEDYFLFIGTIEPRKNIITIVEAFESYLDNTSDNIKLVLAGKIGWMCDDVLSKIRESKYNKSIIMPGFISDSDKAYLLSNAKALVFPSLYEGFGIPILEAFAYGLPVLTSNISSMPEVGGEAAFYIDNATDSIALADLMKKIINYNCEDLEILKTKMHSQLEKFSWNKNAIEMMKIFKGEECN